MDDVASAMKAVPREWFLPRALQDEAGVDGPLPLGHGSTCSQPRTVADMLRLLQVRRGMRVLDVGAGSGWTTALLAHLTGPTGSVLGVELEPAVAAAGAANLARGPWQWASLQVADPEVLGAPDHAPYDRVLVSADAPGVPADLVAQLGANGRMVVPVDGTMTVVTTHGRYRFVPLR